MRPSPNGVAQDLFGLGERLVAILMNFADSVNAFLQTSDPPTDLQRF